MRAFESVPSASSIPAASIFGRSATPSAREASVSGQTQTVPPGPKAVRSAAAEWVQTPDQGLPKTLDYSDVLASPACQATAADKGLDFEGVVRAGGSVVGPADGPDSWILPCDGVTMHW